MSGATASAAGPPIDASSWARVLVFCIGSLGDTVLSVPALQALRTHIGPTATITLLHDDGSVGRVAPTQIVPDGLVDDSIQFVGPDRRAPSGVVPRALGVARRTADAIALARRLRRRRFDAVVNLALADRSDRSLRRDRAFFRLAGIPAIVGFDGEQAGRPEVQVRLDRLGPVGISTDLGAGPWVVASLTAEHDAERWRAAADLAHRRIVTIAPGTLMSAKRWPADRWIELGVRLRTELGLEPVVVGGPADRDEGEQLVEGWAGGANAAGALSPAGSAALMAGAHLHVGVDTGTTHLASASGTPVVALYSQRAPIEQWVPMGPDRWIVDHPVPCAGCLAIDCPVAGHPCMATITVDEVWAQVTAAIERVGTRG